MFQVRFMVEAIEGERVGNMKELSLKIAGLIVKVTSGFFPNEFEIFRKFSIICENLPDLTVDLKCVNFVQRPPGNVSLDDCNKWILHDSNNHATTVYQCSRRDPEKELIFKIDATDKWQNAVVTFLKHKNVEKDVAGIIGYLVLRNRILFHEGLIIHASAIKWEGKGILFTAPSGTGKSTQAEYWRRYKKATILNDDSPVVRFVEGQAVAFGTPWSGSKAIHQNDSAPLIAIVVLEQSNKISISQLSVSESIPYLLPRCLLPYHDPSLMDRAVAVLEKIVKVVPVFHLKCNLSPETIEAVTQCLK